MSEIDTQYEAMTDKEMDAWMLQQQTAYAAGTLPQWKIHRLEKIHGWEWRVERGHPQPQTVAEDLLVRTVQDDGNHHAKKENKA
jgi:hypothetical protein